MRNFSEIKSSRRLRFWRLIAVVLGQLENFAKAGDCVAEVCRLLVLMARIRVAQLHPFARIARVTIRLPTNFVEFPLLRSVGSATKASLDYDGGRVDLSISIVTSVLISLKVHPNVLH